MEYDNDPMVEAYPSERRRVRHEEEVKRLQAALVEAWNGTPEGTPVIVTKDDKSEVKTKTRSIPWLLGGHTAVIQLEGISGCYVLERVRRDV